MADNLLDKASILLTPTAYDNGSMLSIKPENGDGDFDFERNSAATRVNAQGLVENVQIISSELVSNGNFSQIGTEEVLNGNFSQEGSELITNGTFENNINGWVGYISDSSWDNGTIKTTATTSVSWIRQNQVTAANKSYKLTFKAKASDISQNITIYNGAFIDTGLSFDAVDVYQEFTYYFYTTVTNIIIGQQGVSVGDTINFDNVSVKEVGQNWTLGSGWSIGDGYAVTDGTINKGINQEGILTSGKFYKISLDVNVLSGSLSSRLRFFDSNSSGTTISNITSSGTYTFYASANKTGFQLISLSDNTAEYTATNFTVKEVGQDWTLGTGWSIGGGKAIGSSATGTLQQLSILQSNKTYKLTYTILDYVSGSIRPYVGTVSGTLQSSNGTFTEYITSLGSHFYFDGVSAFNGSITNISVKEITDDTNIPRINYEGFSYQDSLGSEEVVNGDFATDSDWTKATGWTISGGTLNGSASTGIVFQSNLGIVVGKTYKVVLEISNYTSGSIRFKVGGASYQNIASEDGVQEFYFVAATTANNILFSVQSAYTGSIDNVSVKEYLGQEVVPDSGCGSWLLEPQSTNLLPYSEDFSQWTTVGSPTITSNYGISPDGNQNSTRMELDASERIYFTLSASGDITFSVSLKGSGVITLRDNTNVYLQDVTLTSEWARYDLSFNSTITNVQIQNQTASVLDCEIWGAQVEQQSYATSYIPTSGAATTRLQDIANNSGNASLINSTEGVLYAEIAALADDGTNRNISLSKDAGNRVNIFYRTGSNTIRFIVRVNNANLFDTQITLSDITNYNKVALSFKENEFKVYVNGVKEVEQLIGSIFPADTLDKLGFNQYNSGGLPFYGKAKALAVYKEALTDAQLQSLTTI